jgi:hypothetical protein
MDVFYATCGHRWLQARVELLMPQDCSHWAECNSIGPRELAADRMASNRFVWE